MNFACITHFKVFKPRNGAITHIGNILIAIAFPVSSCLGKIGMYQEFSSGIRAIIAPRSFLAPEIAGDPGLILSFSGKWPSV